MLHSKTLIRAAAAALLVGLVAGGAARALADDQGAPASAAELQDRMERMEQMMRSMQGLIGPMQQMMGQMQQMMGTMQQMMGRSMGMAGRDVSDIDIEGNTIMLRRRHEGGMGWGMGMMGRGAVGGPDDAATQALRREIIGMHRDMPRRLSGDPDRDFAAVMIPHHQAAVDMANIELKYGKDEDLKKLAQAIVAAQADEIATLKAWLAKNPGK